MEVQGLVMFSTGHWRRGTWMFGHGESVDRHLAPPCFPGGEIYLAENWATEERFDSYEPSAIPTNPVPSVWLFGSAWYGGRDALGHPRPGLLRRAYDMPAWASRRRMKIGEVGVRRLLELTDADLLDYGVHCNIDKFLSDWDESYGGSPSAAKNDPLCWIMIEDE